MGTTYGAGDGSTTFNLPDLRVRVAVAMGSNAAVASLGQSENLAEDARSPEHTHSVPAHYHGPGTLTVAPAGNHGHLVGTVQKRVCGTGCSVAAELNISVPSNYSANDIFDPSYSTSGRRPQPRSEWNRGELIERSGR